MVRPFILNLVYLIKYTDQYYSLFKQLGEDYLIPGRAVFFKKKTV